MTPTVTAAQEKGIKVVMKTHLTLSQNQKKSGAECCPKCCPETSKIRHRCATPQNSPSKGEFAVVLAPLFSPTLASDVPFK